jgi:hypothetical protein
LGQALDDVLAAGRVENYLLERREGMEDGAIEVLEAQLA